MGRKIPAKKHRGVKDPLVQQAKRLQDLKGKINAPPKDPDEQPVPQSLIQLFSFQNRSKEKNSDSKKKKKGLSWIKDKDTTSPHCENPITKLQKLPGESGRGFSLRINSAMKTLHNPTLQEDYPEDVDTEDIKGAQMAFQQAQHKKKQKKRAKSGNGDEPIPKLSRAQKLALKKKAKQEKILQERGGGELQYERVSFGDVVHAPPTLLVKPRRANKEQGAPRPGRRDLLLSAMLLGGGKRKKEQLPAVELERRERARLEAVAAYRALKKTVRAPNLADTTLASRLREQL